MRKSIATVACLVLLLSGCSREFNKVYRSTDYDFIYEYAKECFAMGRYSKASTLLAGVVTIQKGTDKAEECLYMLAMSQYCNQDYETAAMYFKKYTQSYPKGVYAENASYYIAQSLYMSTPEPRLDQTETYNAIKAYQEFIDLHPDSRLKETAQAHMFELQDKLVRKELYSARLYYNLGSYFGNCSNGGSNYEACIVTAQNALKDYPYTALREEFYVLIMKSKYGLAQQSVEQRKAERYRDAEDECYGFINQFPESKEVATAERFIEHCKKYSTQE